VLNKDKGVKQNSETGLLFCELGFFVLKLVISLI
jgi:hypothetical protein